MKNIFSIKKYSKELKISPVFIEITASVIAGCFMFLWGLTFFSNTTFQYSIFTKIRNIFISDAEQNKMMSGIYVIDIDYEARIIADQKNSNSYDMLAESIKFIASYAESTPDKKIVIGLNTVYIDQDNSDNSSFDYLIETLATLPENLIIVFGGALNIKADRITFLRMKFIYNKIIKPAINRYEIKKKNKNLKNRIFIGNIHYIKSKIKNGFNSESDSELALGYYPTFNNFYSLPFIMYLAGNIFTEDECQENFYSDLGGDGLTFCNNYCIEKIEKKTRIAFSNFENALRYNFFTHKDIINFKYNVFSLSELSKNYSNLSNDSSIYYELLLRKKLLEIEFDKKETSITEIEYFFISHANPPTYVYENDNERDEIITAASYKNNFTYEYAPIHGVMTHITALSNLIHSFTIRDTPSLLNMIILILLLILILFITWNKELLISIIYNSLILFFIITFSFLLFTCGFFLPVRLFMSLSFIVFNCTVLIRFFYTTRNIDKYLIAIRQLFSHSQIRAIEETSYNSSKPTIINNGVVMILLLKKNPCLGEVDESAKKYKTIIENFTSLITQILENHNGGHDLLYMGGIIGFWNVPIANKNSELNAFKSAKKCMKNIDAIQKSATKQSNRNNDKKYRILIDITLHKCRLFTGCIRKGDIKKYIISGPGLAFSMKIAESKRKDKKNNILMTEEFYKIIEDQIKEKVKKDKYEGQNIFKIKKL